MTRLRLWCTALLAWFAVFFNIERLYAPLNISSFVYVLAAGCSVLVLLCPWLVRLRLRNLLLCVLAVLLGLKHALGYRIGGGYLPITVTEFCAAAVSIALARQVALLFEVFQTALFHNMVGELENRTQPFDESGQAGIYREVRRARLFERPLALLAISLAPRGVQAAKDRFMREMTQRMLGQYVTARVADLLSRGLKDCDVIVRRNCHFVVLLPETRPEQARAVSQRLQADAQQKLGLELNIGLATFPDEEVTLVRLLERAEEKMRGREGQAADRVANGQAPCNELSAAHQPAREETAVARSEHDSPRLEPDAIT